jgi:hypothetical protein
MNYSIWKSENGFEPSQFAGGSLFEAIIFGILFFGFIYLIFGILAAKLFLVDKLLRVFFPSWFVDAVPEFVMSLLCTAMFPPFLIYGLISNEKIGPGFLFGGILAWIGWISCITYFHPSFIVYLLLGVVAPSCAFYVVIYYVLPMLFGWLTNNINFQPILGFFKNRK